MGIRAWTTNEQLEWLSSRKKSFADAQATGSTNSFIAATAEAFIKTWPLDDPTLQEVTDAGGNLEAAIKQKNLKLRDRVGWWFRNCARVNATGGRGKGARSLIPITNQCTRPLMPYQAYMQLYSGRVMPVIQQRYKAYKAITLEEGRKGLWAFTIDEAKQMLGEEPEDVRQKVEEYRKVTPQEAGPLVIEPRALLEKGLNEAQKVLCDVQKNINCLSRSGEDTLKKIEELTGFKGIMLIGGPYPETGCLVTMAIQNGQTLTLGSVFSHTCENWGGIQTSFEQFIASCFPTELPAQLEAIFRGQQQVANEGDASAPPSGDNVLTSALAVSTSTATSSTSPDPTFTTSSTAAGVPSNSSGGSPSGAGMKPREKTYDEIRSETIAQNMIMLARIKVSLRPLGGEIDEGSGVEDLDMNAAEDGHDTEAPEWARKGKGYLIEISTADFWLPLIEAWWALEQSLGFDAAQLLTKGRPEEIGSWIKSGRKASPIIKSLTNYVGAWKTWWAKLQPGSRRSEDTAWPLLNLAPESQADWDDVRKGGPNGAFVIVMSLAWWVEEVEASGGDMSEVVEAVEDATWAFSTMAKLPAVGGGDDGDTVIEKSVRMSKRLRSA